MIIYDLLVLLLLYASTAVAQSNVFNFTWSNETGECGVSTLSWTGGKTPFRAFILPMLGQPYIYDIPDSAFVNGQGSYPLALQVAAGKPYVMVMSDGSGMGTGGSTGLQIAQPRPLSANSSCYAGYSTNRTSLRAGFVLSGSTAECSSELHLKFTASRIIKLNMTVVPLDQSFRAFDVAWSDSVTEAGVYDWTVELEEGIKFTIMLNSEFDYGSGGVGGIYQVAPPRNASTCTVLSATTTATFPAALTTNALGAIPTSSSRTAYSYTYTRTTGTASRSTYTSSSSGQSNSKSTSAATIVGLTLGICGVLIMFFVLLSVCIRRRNIRRRRDNPYQSQEINWRVSSDSISSPSPSPHMSQNDRIRLDINSYASGGRMEEGSGSDSEAGTGPITRRQMGLPPGYNEVMAADASGEERDPIVDPFTLTPIDSNRPSSGALPATQATANPVIQPLLTPLPPSQPSSPQFHSMTPNSMAPGSPSAAAKRRLSRHSLTGAPTLPPLPTLAPMRFTNSSESDINIDANATEPSSSGSSSAGASGGPSTSTSEPDPPAYQR